MTPTARKLGLLVLVLVGTVAAVLWYLRRGGGPPYYTGFVEGEERVIRSEVTGRVLEVTYAEGTAVPASAVLARLDDQDIQSKLTSKRRELGVLDGNLRAQAERITLVESTWERDVRTRRAELKQAESAANLAERSFAREKDLVATGASTVQRLDDARAGRDQALAALERARAVLARTEAEERTIAVARHELEVLRERRALTEAELAELEVTHQKYLVRAPDVASVVETQFIWPGELAQPGAAIVAVLDPADKYVQLYVPVRDVSRFRLGRRVEIELDSQPGRRLPGEVSFVADQATFTPEKIETRSDRMTQVYRAKIRVLDGVERLQPGTEGNVYLVGELE